MVHAELTIINEQGIHLGPANKIANLADRYDCQIHFKTEYMDVNAKSIINLISGTFRQGDVIQCAVSYTHLFADLKGTLQQWAEEFFGPDTKVKFRPHHFPFTEPSAEVDVSCFKCGGKGCRMCKGSGWIEILGCGMVHPKVLSDCGIDPEVYSGFAFGIGLERITLLKYEIDDMRLLYENDARFLKQF